MLSYILNEDGDLGPEVPVGLDTIKHVDLKLPYVRPKSEDEEK